MIPEDLQKTLAALPQDAALVFRTESGTIGAGYHVTEYKLSQVTSIDCGGRVSSWQEAALQLLDGSGRQYMTVGKFRSILEQSLARLPGLSTAPLHVEFALENAALQIHQMGVPELIDGAVIVHLAADRAHCKPALDAKAPKTAASCCGTGAVSQCCQ